MEDLERRLSIIENALFGRSGTFWHETGILSDGTHWGKVGSMTHLIDSETRRPITKGYHEIRAIGCGYYEFELGASRGKFRLERIF
jgi:hypothetical protein